MKIFGMAIILLVFILLGLVYLSNCGLSESSDYWVYTSDYRYREDFHTNNYTMSDNYITLHGYWFSSGVIHQEDYIINLLDIVSIWQGKNQIYPEYLEVKNSWDNVRDGKIYIRTEAPIWPFLLGGALILAGGFIYLLRGQLSQTFKSVTKRIFLSPSGAENIVSEIKLPTDTKGIIATRDWKIKNHDLLYSVIQGTLWEKRQIVTDEIPVKENTSGIYAYRLGTHLKRSWGKISGIVELTGKCVGHTDGVIRAEKCRILMLFCLFPQQARNLSARYGVPAMLMLDKKSDYERFLISKEGIYWLQHNLDLIKNNSDISLTIEEIMKKEGF